MQLWRLIDCRPLSDRRENPMRRLLTIIVLAAALPACPVFAGDSSLSGNAAPPGGIAGATKAQHKHHAKSKTSVDEAKKDAAAAGTAGAVNKTPKIDPAVNKLNTVLPP